MKKLFSVLLSLVFVLSCIPVVNAETNIVRVTTMTEIHNAMKNAQPGDEIVIASGTYQGKLGTNASGFGSAYFNSDMSGTADAPITIRSEDPENPVVLTGERTGTGYVFRITGDYWIVQDLEFSTAQKGIMFDNANYGIIRNCKVYNIGMEGIHLRDGSSYNLIDGCTVTDTGVDRPDMGEGIYVGSANGSWNEFSKDCNYNTIENSVLGPNVGAEHFDIKEGTIGTVIRNNIMHGTGISGGNYADSFIDLKGNDAVVTGNIGYRENNSIIVDAVQLHNQLDDWGNNNEVSNNTFYMDDETAYVINSAGSNGSTSATTCGNVRVPEGNMYTGNVIEREPDVVLPLSITAFEGSNGEYSVTTEGGTGALTYYWYIVGNGQIAAADKNSNSRTCSFTVPEEAGTYSVRVYVSDSTGTRLRATLDFTV